ncbi:hypothetical protein TorRG33x02_101400 [Trema orientale]|uniref:Uncharacterized protein n=1 Tax=Trema orientale TaxID=63057 RepID=A0A2P5F8I4_TREOI|nr:hypothetical protein TorRG33x02_101400 [Trema orientale]
MASFWTLHHSTSSNPGGAALRSRISQYKKLGTLIHGDCVKGFNSTIRFNIGSC